MKLKVYSLLFFGLFLAFPLMAQWEVSGRVVKTSDGLALPGVDVYAKSAQQMTKSGGDGRFSLSGLKTGMEEIVFFSYEYEPVILKLQLESDTVLDIRMEKLSQELTEVVVRQKREEVFGLKRLMPVDGTAIYAGKKSEVVLVDQLVGSLATGNARQVYGQVVGLNIYENNDAGLQLNIGGRGLDPNRTSNFNTRQNGYDISADVLGYPESYYTPPVEAISEIQVVRGAASLQYGTQFGGLINFKLKQPVADKKIAVVSRQTMGSFGLFTSFNSLSGTLGKTSYYTYFNYKTGDGYRQNSSFDSKNYYGLIRHEFSIDTRVSLEYTHLDYLAQQPGGLTDQQFAADPIISNRNRNWFAVNWNLFALKARHKFSARTEMSLQFFGLNASRKALGFRGDPSKPNDNPIVELDEQVSGGGYLHERDLIAGEFKNWGVEYRFLSRYLIGNKQAVFLLGAKYYKAKNTSLQGPASTGVDADISFKMDQFPDYPNRSDFVFPNSNLSFFGEHIFPLSDRLTVTPGFRLEFINTESRGTYNQVNFDNAGNPISNQLLTDNRTLGRSFMLFGLGIGYVKNEALELYGNFSQNYRSVTFSDIRTVSPTFIIDPEISDERGFTLDVGIRGKVGKALSYDMSIFGLLYNDRIGIVLDNRANRVRKNIGKAWIYGLEMFADWNLLSTSAESEYKLNWFVNSAFTGSEYLSSEVSNVTGKKVEFIPLLNLKTGITAGYKNLLGSLQFTYLSQQYTDVENSPIPDAGDSRSGVIGEIPAYEIMDLAVSYSRKFWKLESGVNNLLNTNYFTRRATGYPGPGIIPSDGRNYYLTLQLTF